jgi:hypothetical protein
VAHPVAGRGAHRPRLLAAPSAQRATSRGPRWAGAHLSDGPVRAARCLVPAQRLLIDAPTSRLPCSPGVTAGGPVRLGGRRSWSPAYAASSARRCLYLTLLAVLLAVLHAQAIGEHGGEM